MIEILTLIFAGAAATPIFGLIWKHLLRYRWYRTVVTLREERSHTAVGLPSGIKKVLTRILHPVRQWHGRTTAAERTIQHFVACPFYQPNRCVYRSHNILGSVTRLGCQPRFGCHQLGTFPPYGDPTGDPCARRRELVRGRRSKHRPHRYTESSEPCRKCGLRSTYPERLYMFDMGDGYWLCSDCFGVSFEKKPE